MLKKVAWFVVFLVLAVACLDEPDCFSLNNNLVGISFKKLFDRQADTVALIAVAVPGTDSIFHESKLLTGLHLPLNYLMSETSFLFDSYDTIINVGYSNLLTLQYSAKAQFVSEECGERFVLSNLKILNHDFDSVRLLSDRPSNLQSGTQIEIYRCPRTNFIKFSFRQLYPDTVKNGKPLEIKFDSVSADYSSIIFYEGAVASALRVPLNPDATTAEFYFKHDNVWDTVLVNYEIITEALFTVCGAQKFFSNLSVADHDFEIMRMVRDSIQDPPVTNVSLLRCPETNLLRILFKKSTDANAANDTVAINQITAGHTPEVFYPNTEQTFVTLPLDTESDVTTFVLDLESGIKTLSVSNTRTVQTFHTECGEQTTFSNLSIDFFDFANEPEVVDDSIQFPTVTNLEIVKD